MSPAIPVPNGRRAAAGSLPPRYEEALRRVVDACREASERTLGLPLPPIRLVYSEVEAANECIRTDYRDAIYFDLSSPQRFRPPPHGFRCIYATCHELGHIVVARLLAGRGLPPVVWDEALAHLLAVRLFVPAVWEAHGADLWPDPYPDYGWAEGAGSLPDGPRGHLGDYETSLRALEGRLGGLVARGGWRVLARSLARLQRHDLSVLRFWPALSKAQRTQAEGKACSSGS